MKKLVAGLMILLLAGCTEQSRIQSDVEAYLNDAREALFEPSEEIVTVKETFLAAVGEQQMDEARIIVESELLPLVTSLTETAAALEPDGEKSRELHQKRLVQLEAIGEFYRMQVDMLGAVMTDGSAEEEAADVHTDLLLASEKIDRATDAYETLLQELAEDYEVEPIDTMMTIW